MADAEVELQQIGLYTVTRPLSAGSTSSLYLGRQQQRKKDIVIKLLHAPLDTTEAKEAFLARAKQLKKLKHRYIIDIQDFGLTHQTGGTEDYGYLIMQYAPGDTLRQHIPPGRCLPADEVKRMLSPLASALHYAHVSNIQHGNLHPGNLLIDSNNDILLADFSFPLQNGPSSLNQYGPAIPYMSPEQLRGELTAACDQYSLAVMVYEWLCGQRPYEATEREKLLRQQEHDPLPEPRSLNAAISSAVERVLLQALARDPAQRFQHTQAFADNYLHALMGLPLNIETHKKVPSSPARTMIENANVGTPHIVPLSSTPLIVPASSTPAIANNDAPFAAMDGALNTTPTFGISIPISDNGNSLPATRDNAPSPGASSLPDRVSADLCQGGILSQSLPGYEERPAQIEMARLVARSLTENAHAIVEASTGTGKSLAYLLPIVRSGKVAIISTANKALQEQLFYKDIPFVQQHIKHFDAALIKGMGNYLCLDRFERENRELLPVLRTPTFGRLLKFLQDDVTGASEGDPFDGDLDTVPFTLPGELRGRIAADSDQCAWSKCNYFGDCYVREMRQRAREAQVIVVNHTLLLLDAAMEGWLLPERDVVIIDEAHHLEEEATRAFTISVSPGRVQSLFQQRRLRDHVDPMLFQEAGQRNVAAWDRLAAIADPGFKNRALLTQPFQEGLHLAEAIDLLAEDMKYRRPDNLDDKEEQLYDKLVKRARNLASDLRVAFAVEDLKRRVYYVERSSERGGQNAGLRQ